MKRDGPFVLGGLARAGGRMFGRVDLGAPIPNWFLPNLRVVVVIESRYGSEGMSSTSDLAVAPELQNAWRLPLGLRHGELVLALGVGLQRTQDWVRLPAEPYWPSKWESMSVYSYRLDIAFQYRTQSGLLLSLQPFGAVSPYSNPTSQIRDGCRRSHRMRTSCRSVRGISCRDSPPPRRILAGACRVRSHGLVTRRELRANGRELHLARRLLLVRVYRWNLRMRARGRALPRRRRVLRRNVMRLRDLPSPMPRSRCGMHRRYGLLQRPLR